MNKSPTLIVYMIIIIIIIMAHANLLYDKLSMGWTLMLALRNRCGPQ